MTLHVLLKTLTSGNDWWNSLTAKAASILESVGLAITNKIERDLNLSLALGGFFWERAARDTTRALKASQRMVYTLASNSLYVPPTERKTFLLGPAKDNDDEEDAFESLNTPVDEIKTVTRKIQDIFSGTSRTNGRSLSSLMGRNASISDRARRAYVARKKRILDREREPLAARIGRLAGDVIDGSWKMKEDISAEPAGYKTRALREGVSIGVQALGALTGAVASVALPSSAPKEFVQNQLSAAAAFDIAADLESLKKNKENLALNLQLCLEDPADTWLVPELLQAIESKEKVDRTKLEGVVSKMISVRDKLKADITTDKVNFSAAEEKERVRQLVEVISRLAKDAAGKDAGTLLTKELVWDIDFLTDSLEIIDPVNQISEEIATRIGSETKQQQSKENSLLSAFSEEPRIINGIVFSDSDRGEESLTDEFVNDEAVDTFSSVQAHFYDDLPENMHFAHVNEHKLMVETAFRPEVLPEEALEQQQNIIVSPQEALKSVMDVEAEVEVAPMTNVNGAVEVVLSDEKPSRSVAVEVLAGDFEFTNVKAAKAVQRVDGDMSNIPEKENLLVTFALRSLDVVFFVAEKIILVSR